MFLYPAKGPLDTEINPKFKFLSQTWAQEVLRLYREKKKDSDVFKYPWGPGSLFQPLFSYCSHHHSKHATLLCCYISSSSVQPLPPTGHPEACWNTMPVLAQAPTSGPNVEVTSSGKNGIVSVEKLNTRQQQSPVQNSGLRRTFPPIKINVKV